jgi:hypothetical protein
MRVGLVYLTVVVRKSFTVDMWVNTPSFPHHDLFPSSLAQAGGHYKITEVYTLAKAIRLFCYRRECKKSKTPEAMQNGVTVLRLSQNAICVISMLHEFLQFIQ